MLEGERIQEYDIEIQKIIKQSHPNGKGMILKIIDHELLLKPRYYSGYERKPYYSGRLYSRCCNPCICKRSNKVSIFIEWMLNEVNNLNFSEQI